MNYKAFILDTIIQKMPCTTMNATSLLLSTGEYFVRYASLSMGTFSTGLHSISHMRKRKKGIFKTILSCQLDFLRCVTDTRMNLFISKKPVFVVTDSFIYQAWLSDISEFNIAFLCSQLH